MIVVLIIVIVWYSIKTIKKNPKSKYWWDYYILKMPVFGDLFRKIAITRFAGTLSTLINAGVPILQALDIVRDSSGNEVVSRAMQKVYQSVKDGETIHEPLSQCLVFPPLVVHMVAVGEETGAIDAMLEKIADFYDEEVETAVHALTSMLEPLMMVLIGGIVGSIIIGMYLPIFDIVNKIK